MRGNVYLLFWLRVTSGKACLAIHTFGIYKQLLLQ